MKKDRDLINLAPRDGRPRNSQPDSTKRCCQSLRWLSSWVLNVEPPAALRSSRRTTDPKEKLTSKLDFSG
jgi:hypothetical protein